MKMKFIGENGSLGFRNGRVYDVSLTVVGKKRLTFADIPIIQLATIGNGSFRYCQYEGDRALKRNWEEIETDKQPPKPKKYHIVSKECEKLVLTEYRIGNLCSPLIRFSDLQRTNSTAVIFTDYSKAQAVALLVG